MTSTTTAPPTRGAKKKERTRRQLIAAAVDVIAQRGEAFSVSDITERAGVSNGTFYNYFDDRDALIQAIVPDIVGTFADESAVTIADADAAVRFASISAMALARAVTSPDEILVLLRLDAAQQAIAGGSPIRHLRQDIADGFRAGRFTVEPTDALLDVTVGGLLTAARRLATSGADDAYTSDVVFVLLQTLGLTTPEARRIADESVAVARVQRAADAARPLP